MKFMLLLDFAAAYTDYKVDYIMEHLIEITKDLALDEDPDKTDEEFVSTVENFWTNTINFIFHRMKKVNFIDQSITLKKMIAEFNSKADYQFTFGNDELSRTLKLYNDHVEKQKTHSERL